MLAGLQTMVLRGASLKILSRNQRVALVCLSTDQIYGDCIFCDCLGPVQDISLVYYTKELNVKVTEAPAIRGVINEGCAFLWKWREARKWSTPVLNPVGRGDRGCFTLKDGPKKHDLSYDD
jgi:hypothetical protein